MSKTTDINALFQNFTFKNGIATKNRIAMSPMTTWASNDREVFVWNASLFKPLEAVGTDSFLKRMKMVNQMIIDFVNVQYQQEAGRPYFKTA